ncbi:hypothetical protein BD311DRAFT_433265 [Dichomitus squalens]|uniref:Uncharacterized protein n=1 Tax=Dichomitus squalens TaxID=114155 RepID=A0A4Q9N3L9_9APHY|nr:hypothetical protein BD311DRAFT_433265 [Dichomitus squalens]
MTDPLRPLHLPASLATLAILEACLQSLCSLTRGHGQHHPSPPKPWHSPFAPETSAAVRFGANLCLYPACSYPSSPSVSVRPAALVTVDRPLTRIRSSPPSQTDPFVSRLFHGDLRATGLLPSPQVYSPRPYWLDEASSVAGASVPRRILETMPPPRSRCDKWICFGASACGLSRTREQQKQSKSRHGTARSSPRRLACGEQQTAKRIRPSVAAVPVGSYRAIP